MTAPSAPPVALPAVRPDAIDDRARLARLAALVEELADGEGFSPSRLPGVRFIRAERPYPRAPADYEPSILLVAQGRKRGYLGRQAYVLDASHYLILAVPLPFECETEASPAEPLLGVAVRVEPLAVGELLLEMGESAWPDAPRPRGICSTPLDGAMIDAAVRLLESLRSPLDARVLGPQIVRELTYRALRDAQGDALRALAARGSCFARVASLLSRLRQDYARPVSVETLAAEAHMSPSAFHHAFKAVTGVSPLQYLKSVRLHQARRLLTDDRLTVAEAALRTGYASPSQFSREYKRFFGISPSRSTRPSGGRSAA